MSMDRSSQTLVKVAKALGDPTRLELLRRISSAGEMCCKDLVALAERFGAVARLTDVSPACPAFAGDPLVERLRERTGARVEPKQAWTDVARLAAAGVPAVNFGPGATAQAHQQGEWVELAALPRAYRALERFLRR